MNSWTREDRLLDLLLLVGARELGGGKTWDQSRGKGGSLLTWNTAHSPSSKLSIQVHKNKIEGYFIRMWGVYTEASK
nr:hypothetical protein Q903MT_gene4943 [Picea sitchensis]